MIMLMLAGPAVLICKETVIRSLSLHLRHLNRKDINMDNTVKNRQCSDGANNYGSSHCKPKKNKTHLGPAGFKRRDAAEKRRKRDQRLYADLF